MRLAALSRQEIWKHLLHGSAGSIAVRSVGHVLRFALGVLLARSLGPEGFGIYSYAITVVALVSIPGMLGMDHIVVRFLGKYLENEQWGLARGMIVFSQKLVFWAGLAVAILAALFFQFVQADARSETASFVILLALTTVPMVVASQTRQALCRALHRPVLAQIPENILYPGSLAIFFLLGSYLVHGYPEAQVAGVANIFAWALAWTVGWWLLSLSKPKAVMNSVPEHEVKAWFSMVPGVVAAVGGFLVLTRTDVVVLEALFTPRDVGLYVAAARGSELMQFLYEAATLAGAAMFASLYMAQEREKIAQFVLMISRVIFWGSLPVYLLFMLNAEWLLGIFGSEYIAAKAIFMVLTTAYFVSSVGGPVIPMMFIVKRQREVAYVIWAFALLNAVLCIGLAGKLGVIGAAWALGLSIVAMKFTLMLRLYLTEGIVCLPFKTIVDLLPDRGRAVVS